MKNCGIEMGGGGEDEIRGGGGPPSPNKSCALETGGDDGDGGGASAMSAMLNQLSGGQAVASGVLECSLVVRGTCGPPTRSGQTSESCP